MADESTPSETTHARRPRRGRPGLWMLFVPLALLTLLGIAFLSLTGRPVVLPDWAAGRIERAIAERSGGFGVDIGSVVLEVGRSGHARVLLRNVALESPAGASLGLVNSISARLEPQALLGGRVNPAGLVVSGAQLIVRRAADGSFGVSLGDGAEAEGDLPGLLDRIDAAVSAPAVARLSRISADDLTITLEDARSGRLWQVTGGRIDIRNAGEAVEIKLISDVFNGTESLAQVQLSFESAKGSRAATLSARITDAPARDIALQAPALAFLGALDARVSGALRTVIAGDGSVESLDGTLDIGRGALRPTPGAHPVGFNSGRAYFSYDPGQQKIAFSEISVESDTLRLSGRGQAYLGDFNGPWPGTLMAQVALDGLALAPEGVFAEAVRFEKGNADFRLRLDPFTADFGQVVLSDGAMRVVGRGTMRADAGGWTGAVDLSAPRITPDRLLALWPLRLGPNTRRWLGENLSAGALTDVTAGVRLAPGARPAFGFTFDYEDASVRFLPEMPAVTGGAGHAALQDGAFTIVIADGSVAADGGGPVSVGETSFRIDDVFAKPGNATLSLRTESRLRDVLKVMDRPPFRILEKSGRPADMVSARAVLKTVAHFPLEKEVALDDVDFEVSGRLEDVRSGTIVPGRSLAADTLSVEVVPGFLTLSGQVALDGLPLDVTFRQPLDKGGGPGRVTGSIELSGRFLETFGVGLPSGTVTGRGTGRVALDLAKGAPPTFTLVSDLAGVGLDLPALSWSKPAEEPGRLEIAGRLGDDPEIERIHLAGPGLDAEGAIEMAAGGAFVAADFSRVTAGGWFDAPVRVEARGAGRTPRIVIPGGTVDLGRRPDGGGGSDPVPLALRLDALRLTDTIALTGFSADLTAGTGLDGSFRATVNGGAALSGTLVPQRGRTAIRLQGANAGAILRDAGLFRSLDKGKLDLILTPRQGAPGFDGQLEISQAFLGDQSVVVDMLDAVSVVGLIDQLRGAGVQFDTIEGRFRLTDDRLTLTQGSAVGASLGVSLDGIYDIAAKRLDMQGVMSPIYLLNAVGSIFTRRGEGLFGFTFRLRGPADKPQVSVNPLSILTPGMFREIFRRPPPE